MNIKHPLKEFIWVLLELIILIGADSIIRYENSSYRAEKKISSSLLNISKNHNIIVNDLRLLPISEINCNPEFNSFDEKTQKNQAVYVLNNNLIFWNSNIFEPRNLPYPAQDSSFFFKQANEIFFVTQYQNDTIQYVVATLVYRSNPYKLHDNVFVPANLNGIYSIDFQTDDNDNPTFTLNYRARINDFPALLLFFLILLIQFTLYKGIYKVIQRNVSTKGKYWFFFICSSIVFVGVKWAKNPLFFSTSSIFDLACITPSSLPTLSLSRFAELVLFLMSNIFVLTKTTFLKELKINNTLKIIISSTLFIFIYLSYVILLFKLIESSSIPFSFLQIYNTTVYSYIFLILISVMTSSIIILLHGMMKQYVNKNTNIILSIIVFVIIGFLFELIIKHYTFFIYTLISNIIGLVIFITILIENKYFKESRKITGSILVIVLMTILLTHVLYRVNEKKEKKEMEWFALIVGDESDKGFENACSPILLKIKDDDTINKWRAEKIIPSDDSIISYLNKYYFTQYQFIDYHKSAVFCKENTHLLLNDSIELSCDEVFKAIEKNNHIKMIDNNLILIDDPSTDSYYIASIDFYSNDSLTKDVLYIEFYKEYIMNSIGIPEMLTSYQNVIKPDLNNYSFSCYDDGILSYKYGSYNYPNDIQSYRFWNRDYVKTKNFKHLIINTNNYKTIIVTVETSQWMEIIAPFSYCFLALLLMYFFNMRIENGKRRKPTKTSLHSKMQWTFLMTLGFSFLVVGVTSFLFIRNNINKNISNSHFERSKIILTGLEETVKNKSDIEDSELINKYKETFFTDINIYNIDGELINATQPELFNGISTKLIDKSGYEAIIKENRRYFSHSEYIEGIEYQSIYIPITDKTGAISAILNIPYFNNNLGGRDSMSNFIITYINIMLVLMGLSGIVVILITRNTIKPLSMIQEQMRQLKLGGSNKEIDWESDDEIGDLIKQYNKLVSELDASANKLARSERETAWREMARQVAHEIKNPLTPMKLSLQYLQMSWDEQDENIDSKFREITNSILEQIDSLTDIATSFSNYAKLPQNNPENFNLNEMMKNIINLYDKEPNICIDFEEDKDDNMVFADKNNLGRVFGNIIKNAIQAIGNNKDGRIAVKIKQIENKYLISIEDNGCGIKEEEKKKIFLPNFTTKSSGMGVGLSIVYDILESMRGKIWFESEVDVGSVFYVEILK